jgi:predicted DNA-binding transcriptional regulator AlpA
MTSNGTILASVLGERAAVSHKRRIETGGARRASAPPSRGDRVVSTGPLRSAAGALCEAAAPRSDDTCYLPAQKCDEPRIEFWTIREVESAVKLKKSAIYQRIARNAFPRPVKLSRTVSVWIELEVRTWMRDAVQHRSRT